MKRNIKRTVAIMVTGLFGTSLAATTDFAVAQNRINAGPVAQMHGGKAFLKPATSLQGTRSQFQRNEAAKALNPQPLPPGPDKTRTSAAAQNRQAVNSQLNKLQSMQQQINSNAFNSNATKALNPQPLPPGPDKTRTSAATQNRQAVNSQLNKLQSMQQQLNGNAINSNATKALNPQPLPLHEKRLQQAQSRADKTRSMIGKLQSSQQQINRNIIGNMR